MAEQLTPQQAQAVYNRGGGLLVSAAAGSGKTKVLVDRLLSYLTDADDPANLDDFLIITYTKAAASELRGKIAAKLTERIAQEPENRHLQKQMQRLYLANISTVHGFCTNILREYAYRLDLSADFRVADENECRELRDTVLKDLLDAAYEHQEDLPDFSAFVDSQGVGRNDNQVPEIIQKVYDAARCHLDPQGWLDGCLESAAPEGKTDASETVWGRFLMDDLFRWLDAQIRVIRVCTEQLGEYPEFAKQTGVFQALLNQLQYLRASQTWEELLLRREIDYGRLVFSRKNPATELTDRVKAAREACKAGLKKKLRNFTDGSAQILCDLSQTAQAARGLAALVQQFGQDYQQAKRTRRVLDFGDLEHKTLDLLLGKKRSGPTAAASEISRRFREIMVDEYQDSNGVQEAIFSALTAQRKNAFMVGDVKQSIYQFRLADPSIFLEKYNQFPLAENAAEGENRKVLLSHNFRSGTEVIAGINDVFADCMSPAVGGLYYGEAEALREGVPHQPLPDQAVELYAIHSGEDGGQQEAAFVTARICRMLSEGTVIRSGDGFRPVTADDIVILLRSPNSMAGDYQKALEAAGVRCAVDGGMDLLKTPEAATLRAILQTIANPRQDIPLLAALASPVFGLTADDLAQIRGGLRQGCFYDALEASTHPKVEAFLEALYKLRQTARMATLTQLMENIFVLTRLDSIYGALPGGQAKKTNLQNFYQMAADYEKNGLKTLDQFLEYLESMETSGMKSAGSSTAGCVTIMSIHKSKGLEFPVVFLCGLSRRFNQESLREQVLCDKNLGLGLGVTDNQARIRYGSLAKKAISVSMQAESTSEEMRVLYVAMTRARDRLIMTYASKSLESDLAKIALRLDFDSGALLCAEADCPGDWVLTAAMQRTEAGELHAQGGKPIKTRLGDYPWKIQVVEEIPVETFAPVSAAAPQQQEGYSLSFLKDALSFCYAHEAATEAPSKQTATGRKGRSREEEAQTLTVPPKAAVRTWRRPSFREASRDGRAVGNAFHAAMQFIRYEACTDEAGVNQEIDRLITKGYLTQEQGKLVDRKKITSFFASDLGRKLRCGEENLREFKFSLLDSGSRYGDGLEGEQVLLQGVVDCAILEKDGIIIIDYKTDHVTPDTIDAAAQRHRPQLETYADALSRIFEQKVKAKYLYFFQMDRFVEV